ncbi:MAG: glycosyltransferase [Phycisphaerae bacterium]|nr:glycosyltransferase [Phycisphaerae bacterium]
MATVDIIIPLYNKDRTVRRTVESVLEQTFDDWRLIIVNDGSTDNSLRVAEQFSDSRIHLVNQDNRGPGAARNRGIHMADAPYLAFLDADDQWHPWHLQNAVAAMSQTNATLVASLYEEWPDNTDMTAYWAKRKVVPGVYTFNGDEHPKDVLSFLFFFHVGNTMVKTSAARQCGGFYDANKCLLGEDTVFFAKLVFCHPFAVVGPASVRHNRQDSALSNRDQRPLDIFLKHPNIITDFCPISKQVFIRRVLSWHAWRVAHFRARRGQKADALFLLDQFPDIRQFRLLYARLRFELAMARWLPLWVRCKCRIASYLRPAREGKRL